MGADNAAPPWLDEIALGVLRGDGAPRREAYAMVPDVVTVAGVPLHLRTKVWRDYSPRIVSRDDEVTTHPVVIGVGVAAPAPAEVPPLRLERVAVFCLDEAWTAVLRRTERFTGRESSLRASAGDGPDPPQHHPFDPANPVVWATGVTVDVVVQLRDESGRRHLVRAGDQRLRLTS
jgi:hypothetical protein